MYSDTEDIYVFKNGGGSMVDADCSGSRKGKK